MTAPRLPLGQPDEHESVVSFIGRLLGLAPEMSRSVAPVVQPDATAVAPGATPVDTARIKKRIENNAASYDQEYPRFAREGIYDDPFSLSPQDYGATVQRMDILDKRMNADKDTLNKARAGKIPAKPSGKLPLKP